ncbi:MAG: hypothetical protein SFW36_11170 [Leptolyngbyaceae cyanobacterium bins.59]|nr:hypothetical protein [Leptolyngbyaceae cyanobacterium bins.59]
MLVICPGVHSPALTQAFLIGLDLSASEALSPRLIFPAHQQPSYSPVHLLQFLNEHLAEQSWSFPKPSSVPLTFLAFSAGVVGAIGAAWAWQQQGGQVRALIAIDGWGVPLGGNFPIHRLSHDEFTHQSSVLLGGGDLDCFYADPPVPHLELWRSPQTIQGRKTPCADLAPSLTAATFLQSLLRRYRELP